MRGILAILTLLGGLAVTATAPVRAETCTAEELGQAVDRTGSELRKFNADTMAALDRKLRELQRSRGWSDEELSARMQTLVSDSTVDELDRRAFELFSQIEELGSAGGGAADCATLAELRAHAKVLLETMQAKAAHLNAKVEAALAEASAPAPEAPAAPSQPKTKLKPPAEISADWATSTVQDPAYQPPETIAMPAPPAGQPEDATFSIEEIQDTSKGFFGTITSSMAAITTFAFQKAGRPNGYILGQEGGGAFLAGLRYGDGTLYLKNGTRLKVYWHGPSIGYDVGAAGTRTMFLVYNLPETPALFSTFSGIDGSAYLVGGVGIQFLTDGKVTLAPVRSGLGLRLGASAGYLRFTSHPTWVPF